MAASDPHRTRWGDDLRVACIGRLDPSVREIKKQDPKIMQHLYDVLEADWNYLGGSLSVAKFRSHCSKVMRAQRAKLHKYFQSIGRALDKKPPDNVRPEQWRSLCEWWISPSGMLLIEKMKNARSEVKHPSQVGRGGYRGREAELVRLQHQSYEFVLQWFVVLQFFRWRQY